VQRKLRGLGHRPEEEAHPGHGQPKRILGHRLPISIVPKSRAENALRTEKFADVQRSEMRKQQGQPDQKADIADAVDQERLLVRPNGGCAGEPKTDEQVGRKAHQFPENV